MSSNLLVNQKVLGRLNDVKPIVRNIDNSVSYHPGLRRTVYYRGKPYRLQAVEGVQAVLLSNPVVKVRWGSYMCGSVEVYGAIRTLEYNEMVTVPLRLVSGSRNGPGFKWPKALAKRYQLYSS